MTDVQPEAQTDAQSHVEAEADTAAPEREEQRSLTAIEKVTFGLLMVILLLASIGISVIAEKTYNYMFRPTPPPPTLQERIKELTTSLNHSAAVISEIEQDIRKRQELVRQLEKDAEIASKLVGVNRDQVEAIAQVLRTQIKTEDKPSFWGSQFQALFYTILGVVLGAVYRRIWRWWVIQRVKAEITDAPSEPSS